MKLRRQEQEEDEEDEEAKAEEKTMAKKWTRTTATARIPRKR